MYIIINTPCINFLDHVLFARKYLKLSSKKFLLFCAKIWNSTKGIKYLWLDSGYIIVLPVLNTHLKITVHIIKIIPHFTYNLQIIKIHYPPQAIISVKCCRYYYIDIIVLGIKGNILPESKKETQIAFPRRWCIPSRSTRQLQPSNTPSRVKVLTALKV